MKIRNALFFFTILIRWYFFIGSVSIPFKIAVTFILALYHRSVWKKLPIPFFIRKIGDNSIPCCAIIAIFFNTAK